MSINPTTALNQAVFMMKKADLRITKQRRDLLNYLIAHQDFYLPVTQVDRYLRQRYAHMSYETVYRNIKELEALAIVETRLFDSGIAVKYQCDFDHVQHCHFICEQCGRVVELKEPPLAPLQQQIPDYTITTQHLEVLGLCPVCQIGES